MMWRRLRALVVRGHSMAPTVRAGDLLLVDTRPGCAAPLGRGAIVAWAPTALSGTVLLKRVVGMPGDEVLCRGGSVWIDGRAVDEPYLMSAQPAEAVARTWALGPDEYLLLGDRRADSLDSRRLGPAHLPDILGVVQSRLWPLWR
ncbi:MAG: signal peptidase I [Candidatus Omnitrophica bacterium]|nr:signal peptidase I [Candidatus Omnitrophota bacterium]